MIPEKLLPTLIAVYGAALSTFIFIRDMRSRRARASVTAGYVDDATSTTPDPAFMLACTLANTGRETIFIDRVGLEIPGFAMISGGNLTALPRFPAEVKPGQSASAYFEARHVASMAARHPERLLRPLFWDQLGRSYRGPLMAAGSVNKTETGWQLETPQRLTVVQRTLRVLLGRHRRAGA